MSIVNDGELRDTAECEVPLRSPLLGDDWNSPGLMTFRKVHGGVPSHSEYHVVDSTYNLLECLLGYEIPRGTWPTDHLAGRLLQAVENCHLYALGHDPQKSRGYW